MANRGYFASHWHEGWLRRSCKFSYTYSGEHRIDDFRIAHEAFYIGDSFMTLVQTTKVEHEIIEIEEAVRNAQLAGDTEFFERILADDFKFITPQGKIVSKREDIDQYKSGHLKMTKVEVAERTIDLFGETVIVRFKVKFEGMAGAYSFSMNMFFTRVYAKLKGVWQMVAGHSSEIEP